MGDGTSGAAKLERWQFTGVIRQVSSRNGLIAIATQIELPRPIDLLLTLHTDTPERFAVDQQWQISAKRTGNRLLITRATCLSRSQGSSANAPKAEPSPALAATTVDREAIAQAALRSHTGLDGWQLSSHTEREDVAWRIKVWEFEARLGSRFARVKVNLKGDRSLVYCLHSTPPSTASSALSESVPITLSDRLTIIPLGAAQSIGASCFRVLIGPYEVVLDTGTRPKGFFPFLLLST